MTGRERFLTALKNGKPDRLPCQVHSWTPYYLKTYLNDRDQYEAYEYFGMDPVIYVSPTYAFSDKDLAKWEEKIDYSRLPDGTHHWDITITTPEGTLTEVREGNEYTGWRIKHMIQTHEDFELWKKYKPHPISVDWTPVIEAKRRIGDRGIVRGSFYGFGQGSPWQSFSNCLYGTEEAIYAAMDEPDWVHYVLKTLSDRKLEVIEKAGQFELDLVECGGGGGSSTVISPAMHREFCLPYDQLQIKAIQDRGSMVVYHLCGGLMPLLEMVVENGADALETMTPPAMGGDCDLAEATRRVGDKLCFVGGLDQNNGFERGNPAVVREMVQALHAACPNGGYICSPSDHFFFGDPENIRAFADACRECTY